MLLEVHERMQLLNMLPVEGKYEELRTIRRQREMLSFTAQEMKILGMSSTTKPDGTVNTTWKGENAPKVVKDVPIDEYMTSLVRKKLAEIEENGKLNETMVSLYEKFVVMFQ